MRIIGTLLAVLGRMLLIHALAWKFKHPPIPPIDDLSTSILGLTLGLVMLVVAAYDVLQGRVRDISAPNVHTAIMSA